MSDTVAGADAPFLDRLQQAVTLLREDHVEAAEEAFDDLLRERPGEPAVMHFVGILRHVQGRSEEGAAIIREAAQAMPGEAGPWNNLGNVLLACGRFDEARQAYENSVEAGGDTAHAADALSNLGTLNRRLGRPDLAERSLRRALELRSDFGEAWYNLSQLLIELGRVHEGLVANSRAIVLFPRHDVGRDQVLRALLLLGERDKAAELYREWLAEEPDNPVVLHQLAACLGTDPPARASDAYVEQVFDSFAQSFDSKLEKLGYQAPQLVADALRACAGEPAADLDIADVGCGTGLVGPLVRPWARTLVGCDLSIGMLRHAKSRKIYDKLHKAELVYYLSTQPASFDLVTSADTLCYFGVLDAALSAAGRALRPGGWLIFSAEALPDEVSVPHVLRTSGRYAHSRPYIEHTLDEAGLRCLSIVAQTLRQETGEPVRGWLVTSQRD